jgi:hypothetical protein
MIEISQVAFDTVFELLHALFQALDLANAA